VLLDSLKNRFGSPWVPLVVTLYITYLATALTYPSVEKPVAGLLLLVGWIGLYRFKTLSYEFKYSENYIIYSFALYSFVSIISFLVAPKTRVGQMHLEDYGVFIMIIPLYVLLRQFRVNVHLLLVVFSVVLIGLGVQSYLSVVSRPSGGVNAMRFANVTLIMSLFLVVASIVIKYQVRWFKVVLLLSACFGLYACIMAQSRGALLSIPLLAIVCSVYFYRKRHLKSLTLSLVFCLVAMVFISQQPRVHKTFDSVERYFEGDSRSAIGARLDMFKAAFILIEEKPIFGYGLGSYASNASKIRDNTPGMNYEVGLWHNPHNEILLVMVEKGFIGLLTLIFLFWAPAHFFVGALKRCNGVENNGVIVFYSFSGLTLLLVYAVAGQSVALFHHDVFNHFFVLMIILFASQIRSHEHYSGLDKTPIKGVAACEGEG